MEYHTPPPSAGRGAPGAPAVGVAGGDGSLDALASATLLAAGAARVTRYADRDAAWAALSRGDVDRLLLFGGPAPPASSPLAGRVHTYGLSALAPPRPLAPRDLPWGTALDAVAAALVAPPPPGPPPPPPLAAAAPRTARLLALAATLRASLTLYLALPTGELGLALVRGRVRAIGAPGVLDAPLLRDDPALALLIGLRSRAPGAPRGLPAELAFIAAHADTFLDAPAYRHHALHALTWLLGHPPAALRAAPPPPDGPALPLDGLLCAALATLPDADLARLGTPANAAPPLRPSPGPATHDARVAAAFAALASPRWPDDAPPPPSPTPGDGSLPPRTARTRPRTGQRLHAPTVHDADGTPPRPCCADPHRLLEALDAARARTERHRGAVPLPGTRWLPVGRDLDDLLLFFRVAHGPLAGALIGALRGPRGVALPVTVRELPAAPGARALRALLQRATALRHPHLAHLLALRPVGDLAAAAPHRSPAGLPAGWVSGTPIGAAPPPGEDVLVLTEHLPGVSLAELLDRLDALGEPLPAAAAEWLAAGVGRALAATRGPQDDDGPPLRVPDAAVTPEAVLVGLDGAVKLDLARALGLGATEPHADDAAGPPLLFALARRAVQGPLATTAAEWLTSAVALTLAGTQRNEAHLLHTMEQCAAELLRLRVAVRTTPLRLDSAPR